MKLKERIYGKLDERFGNIKWYRAFREDYGARTLLLSVGGAALNVVFACVQAVTALRYLSVWYGVFAGYYFILALLRLGVLFSYRIVKSRSKGDEEALSRGKRRIYLVNGALFVPLDIALGAVITVMIIKGKPVATGEIMAITTAAYTTYKVTMAVRNLFKARSSHDPIAQTIRNIGFVDALASLLSLSVTLISTFGEMDDSMLTIVALLGLGSCIFTVGLGSYMIITGAKKSNVNYGEGSYGR